MISRALLCPLGTGSPSTRGHLRWVNLRQGSGAAVGALGPVLLAHQGLKADVAAGDGARHRAGGLGSWGQLKEACKENVWFFLPGHEKCWSTSFFPLLSKGNA